MEISFNYIKIFINIFILILIIGCNNIKGPISSNAAKVKNLGNHSVKIKSYEIPDGVFRGSLWPNVSKKMFQIWLIDGNKEIFYDIPPPVGFKRYKKETTEDWVFEFLNSTDAKQIYIARKKNNMRVVKLELPVKKRDYSFNVLENIHGDELIVFMDISENVRDEGIFGYVIIKDN